MSSESVMPSPLHATKLGWLLASFQCIKDACYSARVEPQFYENVCKNSCKNLNDCGTKTWKVRRYVSRADTGPELLPNRTPGPGPQPLHTLIRLGQLGDFP